MSPSQKTVSNPAIIILLFSGHLTKKLFFLILASDILIASSSQDTYIRLWRLKEEDQETQSSNGGKLSLKGNKFKVHRDSSCKSSTDGNATSTVSGSGSVGCYSVTLEAVLCGHDDWVYSCRWSPAASPSEPLSLLSASMDKTMILWRVCPDSEVWLEQVRLLLFIYYYYY